MKRHTLRCVFQVDAWCLEIGAQGVKGHGRMWQTFFSIAQRGRTATDAKRCTYPRKLVTMWGCTNPEITTY
jgi:hypothetical protein